MSELQEKWELATVDRKCNQLAGSNFSQEKVCLESIFYITSQYILHAAIN